MTENQDQTEALRRRVGRFKKEDSYERSVCKGAEPLITGLKEGENTFKRADFLALARYFLEGAERRTAKVRGRFSIGKKIKVLMEKTNA